MTSRTPRDSRLRLVPKQPLAAARRAGAHRGPSRPAPRPPEGTPPPAELAWQARTGLADAVRVARWAVAEGSAPGALSVETADRAAAALGLGPDQVRTDWDRARLVGLIEPHGGRARPGWRLTAWDRDDSAVLRGWVALFDAWSLARPAPVEAGPTAVAEVVEAIPQLLSLLQLSAGPVPLDTLLDMLRQRVAELRTERCEVPPYGEAPPPGDGAPADGPAGTGPESGTGTASGTESGTESESGNASGTPLAALLDWALGALASVGALVVRHGPDDCGGHADGHVSEPGGTRAPEPGAANDPRPREAELTALGNWAVWVKLEQICVAAQSPAGNIEQPAAAMLRGCARLTPGPARAEYRAWLAARPVGSAVTELLDVARGDDALLRGLAFDALRVVGAPAEPAVRAIVDEPVLRPYALLWLAEIEGADPEDALDVLTREEATWLWVDTAAAVSDHGESPLLVRHLESAVQGTVPALLEEVRAVGHPRTVQVLVALAAAHPDPALAKAVRRAAFQVHTGSV
ncbi:hypothetical protein LRS74_26465 [Streptomyces sp. LX-29]|uniref:hypothetical protein n=1 Tax=Streptomyces sp. LX-29 TaxID=2900152 RepID=UPI00240D3FE9|nr:hypothetical protein [Streptomyces sp. LX-29]WFB10191.1 hypothetical protein LRS74_26465 [Streptomyces sp. LX-29]